MKKIFVALLSVYLFSACDKKDDPGNPQPVGPEIEIMAPVATVDYSNTLPVALKLKASVSLANVYITLTKAGESQPYYSNYIDTLKNTEEELGFNAKIDGGFNNTGQNTIYIRATDASGNQSEKEENFTVLDLQGPEVGFFFFTPNAERGPNKDIRAAFEMTDDLGLKSFKAELFWLDSDGEPFQLLDSYQVGDLNGTVKKVEDKTFTSDNTGYPPGIDYQLIVTVTDVSNNTASFKSAVGTVQ